MADHQPPARPAFNASRPNWSPASQWPGVNGCSGAPCPTLTVNDTDPSINSIGGGWATAGGRTAAWGDLDNDVHATTEDGDTVSYAFKGTGVSYVSEKSDGYGSVQVAFDGAVRTVVDANAPGVRHQGGQTLYTVSGLSAGQHTVKTGQEERRLHVDRRIHRPSPESRTAPVSKGPPPGRRRPDDYRRRLTGYDDDAVALVHLKPTSPIGLARVR
jgi:hypothetical protein